MTSALETLLTETSARAEAATLPDNREWIVELSRLGCVPQEQVAFVWQQARARLLEKIDEQNAYIVALVAMVREATLALQSIADKDHELRQSDEVARHCLSRLDALAKGSG